MQTGSLLYIAIVLLARSTTAENFDLCTLRCAVGGITAFGTPNGDVCDPKREECPPCFNSERPSWSIMGDGTVTCYEKSNGRCKSKQTDCSKVETSPSITTSSPGSNSGFTPSTSKSSQTPSPSSTSTVKSSSESGSSSGTTPKPTSKKKTKKSQSSSGSSSGTGDSSSTTPRLEKESVRPTPVPLPSPTPTETPTPEPQVSESVAITGEKQDSSNSNNMTIIAAGAGGLAVVLAAFGFIIWRRNSDGDDDSDIEDTPKSRFQPSYAQTTKANPSSYGQSTVPTSGVNLTQSNYDNAAPYAFNNHLQNYNNQPDNYNNSPPNYSHQPDTYNNQPQNYNDQPEIYGNHPQDYPLQPESYNPEYTNGATAYNQPPMNYNNFPPPYYNEQDQGFPDNSMPGPSTSYHSSGMAPYDNSNAYGSSEDGSYQNNSNQYSINNEYEGMAVSSTPGPQLGMDVRLSYANELTYDDLQLHQSNTEAEETNKNGEYYDFSGSGEKKRTISNASVEF